MNGELKGRGAGYNPPNRFESIHVEPDPEAAPEGVSPKTEFLVDASRTILTPNDSADVPFDWGLNPYRGCEHGCVYCFARPFHEFLGFSAGLDFETKILVKKDAAELLRRKLGSRTWKGEAIGLSGATDPYQPVERKLGLTRACLEVLVECRNPVGVITKNRLVARDADLLGELARAQAASVMLSITTLDDGVRAKMEPRTSSPADRLAAITALREAGVPVGVLIAPVVPGLTDHEIPQILAAAAEAGATSAAFIPLRLPGEVAPLFEDWLKRNFPGREKKVLGGVRGLRGGKLNGKVGERMTGEGPVYEHIRELFRITAARWRLDRAEPGLSSAAFRRPRGPQLELFSA